VRRSWGERLQRWGAGDDGEFEAGARMNWSGFISSYIVAFIVLNVMLGLMAYMTYIERKVMAAMQDRVGPNRTGPFGLLQPIADGVKLLSKEDIIPKHADRLVFLIAPLISFVLAPLSAAVIPF